MKKLLYILLFCICANLSAQVTGIEGITGIKGICKSDSAIPDYRIDSVISMYLTLNDHFSDDYKSEVRTELETIFDEDYIMPDASTNYYNRFIKDNSPSVNWFLVMRTKGDLTSQTMTKSDGVLQYHIIADNTIYTQTNWPSHTLVADTSFIVMSIDSLEFITNFNTASSNLFGYVPNIDYLTNTTTFVVNNNNLNYLPDIENDNITIFRVKSNSFSGTFKFVGTGINNMEIYSNNFDSIAQPEKWITNNLGIIYMHTNGFTNNNAVNRVLRQLTRYFDLNTPTKNLRIWSYNDPGPDCGDDNVDLYRLNNLYDSAGYSFTRDIRVSTTPSLNQTDMHIPDTFYVLTDETLELYDDCMAGMKLWEEGLRIEYTCSIGEKSTFGYKFDEVDADTGFYAFKAVGIECTDRIDSCTGAIGLIKGGNGNKDYNFNIIGNSLTARGTYINTLFDGFTEFTPITWGRFTFDYNHEGIAGYSWYDFVDEDGRYPIIDSGYTAYRRDTLGATDVFDFTIVQLGINDIKAAGRDTAYIRANIFPLIEAMVDSLLADTVGNIILCMFPKGENTGDGWIADYGVDNDAANFQIKSHFFWTHLITKYSGNRYSDRVFVSPQGMAVDRDNSFPKTDGYHNNAFHPAASGNYQMADALRAFIEGIIKYKE
jgi:hypothetical protein